MRLRRTSFLDKSTSPRPVIYSFLEDGQGRVARRLRDFGADMLRSSTSNLSCWATFGKLGFESAKSAITSINARSLAEDGAKPPLWIIDSLIRWENIVGVKDENDPLAVEPHLEELRQLIAATGVTILLVHHYRKAGDRMRGSSALEGATDGWWDVTPIRGYRDLTRIEYTMRDGEGGVTGAKLIVDEPPRPRFRFVAVDPEALPKPASTPKAAPIAQIRSYLVSHPSQSWRTKEDLCTAAGVGQKYGAKAIDDLLQLNELAKEARGYHVPALKPINGVEV